MTLALFQCVPHGGIRLTRVACGKRHLEAKLVSKGGNSKPIVRDATCAACVIGAAHAREEKPTQWPDGSPIVAAQAGVAQPPAAPSAVVLIHREQLVAKQRAKRVERASIPVLPTKEIAMPRPKMLTHNGKSQSISEWGRSLGMSSAAVSGRIHRAKERGLDEEAAIAEALTLPRDPTQPTTREAVPRTAKARKAQAAAFEGEVREAVARAEVSGATLVGAPTPPRTSIEELCSGAVAAAPVAPERFIAEPADELLRKLGYNVTSLYTPKGLLLLVEAP